MGYAIDRRLIRLTGELLANGSGTFTASDTKQVFRGAMADGVLRREESAAILVVYLTVGKHTDAEATRLFDNVVGGARNDDSDLEPWIVRNIAGPLVRRAAALIAGRKRRRVTKQEVLGLMSEAHRSDGINRDEAMAFLVIRELFQDRMAADAQKLLDELCTSINEDGVSLGTGGTGGGPGRPPGGGGRQCGACSGAGYQTCGSCSGYGHHTRSGTRTRYDGSTEYYQEQVPCSCSGGRIRCGRCGGSGRL